ncbi:MAG: hypothetical protein IT198_11520 [Acidimicrobiia bacterium]|nr:hypothetical protein [Acidimicrobiia bacterium]
MPWVVAGAAAALRYRTEPRFTTDLDLIVAWNDRIPSTFEADGYAVRTMADPDSDPHLVTLRRGSERVDLIVASVEYQHVALERGLEDHVLTVEDVIVHKLIAWRARDRDDIASILEARLDLDLGYIEHWATEWEVLDRWSAATDRA